MYPRVFLIVTVLAVAGCSGSSEIENFALTAQNAEQVSQQGVEAATVLAQMSSLVENFSGLIESQSAQVILCDSGNATLDINDVAPLNEISTGDSVSITFNGCVVDVGGLPLTLNGTLSFTADDVTGAQPSPYSMTFTADFDALTVVLAGATMVIDGGFTLTVGSQDGITDTATITGTSFSAFAQGNGQTFSGTITNFDVQRQFNQNTSTYLFDFNATVAGSAGGPVTYETLTPFTGTNGGDPSDGSMLATGPLGGQITLVAISETNVTLLIDFDGDGDPELTINTTWDVLDD